MSSDVRLEGAGRDVLALAKTVAANEFPVERPSVIGVDRESGKLLRLSPFPWKANDTDPPIAKWGWLHVATAPDPRDPRPETVGVDGEVAMTGYVDAKDAWRLRWPFVRPHLRGSVESLQELARERVASLGFVRPAEGDVVQLPLRYRFRCASDDCTATHELPVLDWEIHEMARLSRERYGPQWATRFREAWGASLLVKYDVHLLLSSYAQSPSKLYVAGLFYPPREREDAHEHLHHEEHRRHQREERERAG
ncbi:MAG TPA: hypothetical protein VJQ09_01485 [Candidatus Limnocylindria bacterium]|nr:hypothetical protein [Candidatus Limnocylindria bacterium]